ncbi:MAG: hypothetical protein KDA63_19485, partial [Planctomycetales bacterium]|nr:hypothetical protein [Planctomycetales bacterium]
MSRSTLKTTIQTTTAMLCVALLGSGIVRAQDEDDGVIEIAAIERDTPVDFASEILPILKQNCTACHNATDAEGDVVLETPESIRKGGGSGDVVSLADTSASMLLLVTSGAEEPIMPPEDNDVGAKRLTPEQLGLIKLWIDQGATGEVAAAKAKLNWQSLPAGVHPIMSVALAPGGHLAACGRANQVFLYDIDSQQLVTRLTDP